MGKYPIFRHYLEDEDDKPYYTMNSLSFYYEDMERKQKLIESLAKSIAGYDIRLTENLETIEKEVDRRLADWDKQLETFPDNVEGLLSKWSTDGTIDTVIQTALIDEKIEPLTVKLAEKVGGGVLLEPEEFSDRSMALLTGKGTVNVLSEPKYRSVTAEKTDFFTFSTNLANHLTRTPSKSINVTTGGTTDNTTHDLSDFIKINPSTVYTSHKAARKGFYDADKNFISTDTVDGTWTSPTNAHYVRIVSLKVNWEISTQLNIGNSLLEFELYYEKIPFDILGNVAVTPELTTFFNASSNKFNKNEVVDNFVINAAGQLVANAQYCTSGFIEVIPSSKYVVYGTLRIVYFNEKKEFISIHNTDDAFSSGQVTSVPTQAKYMRLAVYKSKKEEAQLNEGDVLLDFERGGYFVKPEYITDVKQKEKLNQFILDSSIEGTFNSDRIFEDYTANGWSTIQSGAVHEMIDAIRIRYPDYIKKQVLTPTPSGSEIAAYHLNPQRPTTTTKKRYPKIFIVTGVHGYERSSVINMYHLVEELCENWQSDETIEALRFNVDIIWIPIVNPHGWNVGGGAVNQRYNSRGIDIARQFPDDWVLSEVGSTTYGGTAPLTEIEALNVKRIFDENPDIDVFYDYHNFGNAINDYIWLATASNHAEQLGEALIKKMTRKWTQDFDFVPDGTWLGYTSIMYQGTMHNYAYKTRGIERSGTFETNNQFHLDPTSVKYNQDSCKAGLEAITNFLLVNLRDLV